MSDVYWNHNTAYHKWILKRIRPDDRVLDVGCGDGLLARRISCLCRHITGIEPHIPSAERAKQRLANAKNATIAAVPFEEYPAEPASFDVVIFAASIHHMDFESCVKKAKSLLAPGGRLLIVGIAKPEGVADLCIEILRVIPAKIGSLLHGERGGRKIGVPTKPPDLSIRQIREIASVYLPNVKIRRGLYYRYLLSWIKNCK